MKKTLMKDFLMKKILIKKIKKDLIFFFLYIKMTNNYYQKHKEQLRKEARERYQNLSKEEKDKKQKSLEIDIKIFLKRRGKRKKASVSS